MPDYPTRMSISATLRLSSSCSHPTCYLQDRDEIADDVIIAISPGTRKPLCESHRNLGTPPHGAIRHKPTSYRRIHKSAFSGHKRLNSTSFCPLSRPWSRHFVLSCVLHRPCIGHFAGFLLRRYCKSCIYARFHSGFSSNFQQLKMYENVDI